MKILNFGSLNIDHVYRIDRFVGPGETRSALSYERNAGGKGLNQSIALARAGATVYHGGMVGEDGRFLCDLLADEGVDTTYLSVSALPTGHAVIQVDPTGQNSILIHAGANGEITPDQIHTVLQAFGAGDYLLLQNEVAGLTELLQGAKERQMTVILNPSPITPDLLSADLSAVDDWILNETEGEALTDKSDPNEILAVMGKRYPHAGVVLTLGAHGAYWQKEGERIFCPARKVNAVDTTAAGDTFTGYFFATLTAGGSPADALLRATCAASLSVTCKGAAMSIPRSAQTDKLISQGES